MEHFETSWKTNDGITIYAQGWEPDSKKKAWVCLLANLDNNCELVLWDNARHEPHKEPEKDEVITTMINWMDERIKQV